MHRSVASLFKVLGLGAKTVWQVDLRLPPWEKPKPPGFPAKGPLEFLLPLMDAYAGPDRQRNLENTLLHPILADISSLPRNMLFVVPRVDILLHEQTLFIQRLEEEATVINRQISQSQNTEYTRKKPSEGIALGPYQIKSMFFDGQIHGWLEGKLSISWFDEYTHEE